MTSVVRLNWFRMELSGRALRRGWLQVWLAMACPSATIRDAVAGSAVTAAPVTKKVAVTP